MNKLANVIAEDDVEFGEYTSGEAGEQRPVIPGGTYTARLTKWATVEKDEYKLARELANKQKEHPETTMADLDPMQWRFWFVVSEGKFAGFELKFDCNRTSTWHKKATATQTVAAMADLPKYDRQTLISRYGSLKGMVEAQPECQLVVVCLQSDHDQLWRNFVNQVMRPEQQLPEHLLPQANGSKPKAPQRKQEAPQGTPTVKQVQVPELQDAPWDIDED